MATDAQLIAALRQADQAGDHAGATRIAQIIAAQRGQGVTAGGAARSFGSGILKGVANLADMSTFGQSGQGAAMDAGSKAANWLGSALGVITPAQGDANVAAQQAARRGTPFESAGEQVARSGVLHAPQNATERFTDEAGQFVPNAFTPGGPAKLLPKVAMGAARVLAPVVAGNAFEGGAQALGAPQWAQNVAHVAGNVVGGGLADAAPEIAANTGNAAQAAFLGRSKGVTEPIADLARTAIDKHGIMLGSDQIAAAGAGGDRAAGIRDSNLSASDPRFQQRNLAQRQAFTSAVGKTFGAPEGPLTTDVADAAKKNLSAQFEAHAANTGFAADNDLLTGLDKVKANASALGLPDNEVKAIGDQIDKIKDVAFNQAQMGVVPGKIYQSMTQSGSPLAKIIASPHGAYGGLGSDLRSVLNDAVSRAAGPESQADLQSLRGQWANLKTVEPLIEKAQPEGLISPALLQSRVNSTFNNAAYGSGGDLAELGNIGQTFMKEPSNSQTSARFLDKLSAAKFPALVAGGVADLGNALHDPVGAAGIAGTAALGYGAGKAVQALKAARSDNPLATAALLSQNTGPMPARILNAMALDPTKYAPAALIPGAIGAANAFGQSAPAQ